MQQVNLCLGNSGRSLSRKEQQAINDWLGLYESIDALPELAEWLEKRNAWQLEKKHEHPNTPMYYSKGVYEYYQQLQEKM